MAAGKIAAGKASVKQKANKPLILSKREVEIIELVTQGLTNQEIAQQLEISKRTVDNHMTHILTKTRTNNRVALVRWALKQGKVCIDEVNCCHLPDNTPLDAAP
ncbi:MAG: response regulator transcription factor [Spirulina sp. SIO3F2]|nr:response regulator transcription factor [Spirulina sp. SIO3F2]